MSRIKGKDTTPEKIVRSLLNKIAWLNGKCGGAVR